MDTLITVGQLILSLSILIVLHEMGHFFPAKFFRTKVEKFYLFFDPWFELFKIQKGETEYGIGWLPLGGYVKIAGMIDESFDTEQMQQPPQPWEFRSKPAWQRLIIMVGGVTVNFILGFVLYSMILWVWGKEYLPTENALNGIAVDSLGLELGLLPGDKVLAAGDYKLDKLNAGILKTHISIDGARTVTVERNGELKTISVSDDMAKKLSSYDYRNFYLYRARVPFVVGAFSKKSPAEEAGLKVEDQIIGIDSIPTPFFDVFFNTVDPPSQPNTALTLQILRKDTVTNKTDTLGIKVVTNENGIIGARPFDARYFYDTKRIEYNFLQSIPAGYNEGATFLGNQIKAFGQMFTGGLNPNDSLGSFISIGKMFGTTWDWERFWLMTAALSLILAFINLLPIPALDGGHVMFLLYEVVSGRKPSDKFMEISTMVGFVILILLMVYAIGLDLSRLEWVQNIVEFFRGLF